MATLFTTAKDGSNLNVYTHICNICGILYILQKGNSVIFIINDPLRYYIELNKPVTKKYIYYMQYSIYIVRVAKFIEIESKMAKSKARERGMGS